MKSSPALTADPAAGILEAQKDIGADLVVMATHGRTGLSHLILGSVAEKVVRETSGPVFISRHGEHLSEAQPFQKILVPVDITEQSGPALSYARQIAEQYGAPCIPCTLSRLRTATYCCVRCIVLAPKLRPIMCMPKKSRSKSSKNWPRPIWVESKPRSSYT